METLAVRDLTFRHPETGVDVLKNVCLSVESGEFIVICGPSGCGKSTLLSQMKTVLAPHGIKSGDVYFEGVKLSEVSHRMQSVKIGFVRQSPDDQVVTDKVWHELAFGLESLGCDTPTIRRKVAEMASFFGIQTWFYKDVNELSGGQKQLLNLASVMVMQPDVLILDEPTSQLDPIAASDFIATIGKINRELGTTVIMTEHRLEEVFPLCTRVVVMENGEIVSSGTPKEVGTMLSDRGDGMFLAMPVPMRIWHSTGSEGECPVTVPEGRAWLEKYTENHEISEVPEKTYTNRPENASVELSDIWFKYEKDGPDVLKGLNFKAYPGELFALLGGNGAGKSTTLSIIDGANKPQRGTVKINGTEIDKIPDLFNGVLGALPQNPQTLFAAKSVREDLFEVFAGTKIPNDERRARVGAVVKLCRLEHILDNHPYDISGGEQQRAALAKVLLLNPKILLLDEPTKGLDAEFKQIFASVMMTLKNRGVTVIMVSHDVEFCAEYADRCAMFFNGGIVAENTPEKFFAGNNFYTTQANRMARKVLPKAVTSSDVIAALGGEVPEKVQPQDLTFTRELDENLAIEEKIRPKPIKLWRKITGAVFAVLAIIALLNNIETISIPHLFTNFRFSGVLEAIVPLIIVILCFARRSEASKDRTPTVKRNLSKRTIASAVMVLLAVPLTIYCGNAFLGGKKYLVISLLVMVECMLPFFLVFEGRKPEARELAVIAVLCAIGVAGRTVLFMVPFLKPVAALVIISAVAFGGESGFLIGAITMLASNMLFGQGQWTPWQMFAMGIIGFLAGVLFRKGLLRRDKTSLCIFGFLATVIIYGGIMNPASAIMSISELNRDIIAAYYISGLPVDIVHGLSTALFLFLAAEPMLEKLDRIKVKYGILS